MMFETIKKLRMEIDKICNLTGESPAEVLEKSILTYSDLAKALNGKDIENRLNEIDVADLYGKKLSNQEKMADAISDYIREQNLIKEYFTN